MKIYVKAPSKKAVNADLDRGLCVVGDVYDPTGRATGMRLGPDIPNGTVIARYVKTAGGNPIAVGYHQWDAKKQRLR